STFWGKAWCENLESYSDFSNRLPRGRTYVRNGSVVHLTIDKGRIEALVSGSEVYEIQIDIAALAKDNWRALKNQSAGKIGTLVELLKGKLSKAIMELVTGREHGLFPKPKEIKMRCSCPDGAWMCKHIAAAMYGVGNRLDSSPELLFVLRGVDHLELIEQAIPTAPLGASNSAPTISTDDLGAIFDIEIGDDPVAKVETTILAKSAAKQAVKKPRVTKKATATKANTTTREKPAVRKARTEKKATATKQKKAKPVLKKV
ncbi:MAG: SWIM zinc finger family protein, partial [Isosphaeraceae bacterium]